MRTSSKNLHSSPWRLSLALLLALHVLSSCGPTSSSEPLVTDVEHTSVKKQTIGNCWLYTAAGWAESLHLSATGQAANLSESWWTWWYWHDQLINPEFKDLAVGGLWETSAKIILERGWLLESDFAPEEEQLEASERQIVAELRIRADLDEGGALHSPESRTPENVTRALNAAFEVKIAHLKTLARPASEFVVGRRGGEELSLVHALDQSKNTAWRQIEWPHVKGEHTRISNRVKKQRIELSRRVMRALNDRKPVVMTMMIDMNAYDISDETFKLERARNLGPGIQSAHMVVLEDYVVDNVPGLGRIGEGDMPPEIKAKAVLGDLVYLKAKNSWGTNRPDRGVTDGYTRFSMDYLNAQLPWRAVTDPDTFLWYTSLADVVLPPGY